MTKLHVLGSVLALILAASLVALVGSPQPPFILCGSAIAAVGVAVLLMVATNKHLLAARYLRLAIALNPAGVLIAFGVSTATRIRSQLESFSLAAGLSAVVFLFLSFGFYIKHVRTRVRP